MVQNCRQCGQSFELTESEIAFYNRKGLDLPRRCAYCRKNNRDKRGNGRASMAGIQQVRQVDPGFHHEAPVYQNSQRKWKRTDEETPFWKKEEPKEKKHFPKFIVFLVLIVVVMTGGVFWGVGHLKQNAAKLRVPAIEAEAPQPTYYLNTYRKKFHRPDCPSVQEMMDENRQAFYGTREEAIAQGYSPCHNCNP